LPGNKEGSLVRLAKFLLTRVLVWLLTIFVGITVVFFLQRAMPSDPIESMISKMLSMGRTLTPEALDAMRETMKMQYGLTGSLFEQYIITIKRLFSMDFGISIANYPTPVSHMVAQALPYTVSLLLTTTLISWVVGNAIGLLAGFKKEKWYSKVMETISMCIYPTPYFMLALVIMILMAFVKRWFPLIPSFGEMEFTFAWLRRAIYNSFMPALSLMLVGTGWWIISMKSLSSNVSEEEYVNYGRLKGLTEASIGYRYVFRNSILSQVTALALHIGGAFSGSLMCEIIFSYPGVGQLVSTAINNSDYNLLTGLIFVSIFAVATSTLVVDLIYPLIDPRIRYS
jgi:peptide/nickel transport system permease protein